MAIIKGPIQMTGSLGNVSIYKRRGSDDLIMRTKAGPSGDKIKRLPQYEGIRNQQKEWSGCTKGASGIRTAFGGLQRIADYNLSATLNGLTNKMQKADTTTEKGKRPVQLSLFRQALDGFNFNRNYPFNSVVRVGINSEVDKDQLSATVSIARINTDIDLVNIQRLPYFRLIVVLGTASDMYFDEHLRDYLAQVPALHGATAISQTNWLPTIGIVEEQVLTLAMTATQVSCLSPAVSALISIAVEFGTVGFDGKPVEVKYAGSGKVLKCI